MKANEFVKKYGWEFAKDTLSVCSSTEININDNGQEYLFFRDDLKRLVDSYELVESMGGLDSCKSMVQLSGHKYLIQAISDVGSCL